MIQLYHMLFDRHFNFFYTKDFNSNVASKFILTMLFYLPCNSSFVLLTFHHNIILELLGFIS